MNAQQKAALQAGRLKAMQRRAHGKKKPPPAAAKNSGKVPPQFAQFLANKQNNGNPSAPGQ